MKEGMPRKVDARGNRGRIFSGSHPEFIANILVTKGSNGPGCKAGCLSAMRVSCFLELRLKFVPSGAQR